MNSKNDIRKIRRVMAAFILLLFLSGLTAIPVLTELRWALALVPRGTALFYFLETIHQTLSYQDDTAPWIFYGYDWLAFAHFVLAFFFLGAYRDPVRNIWIIRSGLVACLLVFPFAFIAGYFRQIPFWWQLVDCSFGLFGFLFLWYCYRKALSLEQSSLYSKSLTGSL